MPPDMNEIILIIKENFRNVLKIQFEKLAKAFSLKEIEYLVRKHKLIDENTLDLIMVFICIFLFFYNIIFNLT